MKTTLNPFENAKRTANGTGGGVSPAVIEEMQAEISILGSQNKTQAQDITDIKGSLNSINDNLTASKYTDANATTLEALTNSFINSIHSSILVNRTIRSKITNNNVWYGIEITKYGGTLYNGIILNLSDAKDRYTFRSSIGSEGASTVISPF